MFLAYKTKNNFVFLSVCYGHSLVAEGSQFYMGLLAHKNNRKYKMLENKNLLSDHSEQISFSSIYV